MKNNLIYVFGGLCLVTPLLFAQTLNSLPAAAAPAAREAQAALDSASPSPLTSELFYQLVVGEMTIQDGQSAAGYALILDAARKSNNALLYQRATDIALQSRSGDAALQAAKAWKDAQPQSREANRYLLQILIALNRIGDTLEPLQLDIELTPGVERPLAIAAIPRTFARVTDKKLAATIVEQAVSRYLTNGSLPSLASSSWATVGRMRLAAGDAVGALDAATRSQMADVRAEGPILVALELMDAKLPAAEALVKAYLEGNGQVVPEIRVAYSRALLDSQRYAEASAQLQTTIREKPDFAPAWLILGSLQLQDNQLSQAQTSLEGYIALALKANGEEELTRGLAQAYLSLAQIAEKRKDFAGAETWIAKIDDSELMIQAQTRRASILASQGKLAQGRQLIRDLPQRNAGDARLKILAEIGLLRELKQYQLAYDLLADAAVKFPDEVELVYDQAMMAEKLNKLEEMEALLRRVIQAKPDYHSAYNALGYSFADRNVRLPEARELIRKALQFAPSDPFIQDSLGWVEFRMGNKAEAVKIFEDAFKTKPDAEIAAHFGEVLWSTGQRQRAVEIWREGQLLSPDNQTLLETLRRLQVKL